MGLQSRFTPGRARRLIPLAAALLLAALTAIPASNPAFAQAPSTEGVTLVNEDEEFIERKGDGRFIARPLFNRELDILYYGVRDPDNGDWIVGLVLVQGGEKKRKDGWEYSFEYPFRDDQADLDPDQPYLLVIVVPDPDGADEPHTFHGVIPIHQSGRIWDKILQALDPGRCSVMALMASQGAFDAIPNCAIFADTHWEPPSLYTHLDWLAERLGFPVYVVDNGRSLREDVKTFTNHSGNASFVDLPVYLKGRDGGSDGMGRRQCTEHYKIRPIQRKIRELLGLTKGQPVPSGTAVELWLGISTDEAIRMKPSRDRWIQNRYPLIEAGMSRKQCIAWWQARYDRPLERSACIGCPYQSRQRWVETKRRWPELFAEAVEIDANLRGRLAFAKEPYLHPRRVPLAQAVSLDEAELGTDGQSDGFGNECEGHCGV